MPDQSLPTRRLASIAAAGLLLWCAAGHAADSLTEFRDRIERAYNARDNQAIEATVADLRKAAEASGQQDLASYYSAYARLRQSAVAAGDKRRARDYLEQCIDELEPLLKRRTDYARARALYASCLGSSANYYVLRAASRGIAAGREIASAVKQAPDDPWVAFHDGVSDLMTPALFGGSTERALTKLLRAAELLKAARPAGSESPVFGEAEAWLYIGRAQLAADRKDKAREAWETARQLAPDSADVRDELAKL